jgi:hypothetical protein
MDELVLPEAVEPGQIYIHEGRTFVVDPYDHTGDGLLMWFLVNQDRTVKAALPVPPV